MREQLIDIIVHTPCVAVSSEIAAEHPWWFWFTWWLALYFNCFASEKWR